MAPDIADGPIGYSMPKAEQAPIALCSKVNKQSEILKCDTTEKARAPKARSSGVSGWLDSWLPASKDMKWGNVVLITTVHAIGVYGFITTPYTERWRTVLFESMIGLCAAFGVTGGVHRLWSHKAYKATTPLRIIFTFCYLCAGQNSIYQWVRDHRVHHKYSETSADPHDSNRGFFFSHVGWLMMKKHPEVIRRGNQIDMSDIENDPVAAWCERYFMVLKTMICFVLPILIPVYCWDEEWRHSILTMISRYIFALNATWSVNSFAHFFGNKPYDKNIGPAENAFVAYIAFGEGWHNYHHMFPSDYRAAEIGGNRHNPTTRVIDMFAKLGWAYDLREPSESLVRATIANRGDGTHQKAAEIAEGMRQKQAAATSKAD